jgi:Ran GTPase-activating protein (RanGAP) involved in mRNA processing and transport
MLSISYCNIDETGADSLFEIIIYQSSKLEEINISGNPIKNEGAIKVFQALGAAKTMQSIMMADCEFDESENVMEALKFAMTTNKALARYDLKHNAITSDEAIEMLCKILESTPHVNTIGLSEWI